MRSERSSRRKTIGNHWQWLIVYTCSIQRSSFGNSSSCCDVMLIKNSSLTAESHTFSSLAAKLHKRCPRCCLQIATSFKLRLERWLYDPFNEHLPGDYTTSYHADGLLRLHGDISTICHNRVWQCGKCWRIRALVKRALSREIDFSHRIKVLQDFLIHHSSWMTNRTTFSMIILHMGMSVSTSMAVFD
jgi:hypothetical protein